MEKNIMVIPPEFAPLQAPPYIKARVGDWAIAKSSAHPITHAMGYFRSHAPMPRENWTLMHQGRIWMSMTPMELESQGYQAAMSSGHVVVVGLGMGALLFGLLRNPKVERITVCEREAQVVSLLRMAAPWFASAVDDGRVSVSICDAFKYVPKAKPDVLLIDIWQGIGRACAESDSLRIQHNAKARSIGWWGQELSVTDWLYSHRRRFPFAMSDIKRYERATDATIVGGSHPAYPQLILAAARNALIGMQLQNQ